MASKKVSANRSNVVSMNAAHDLPFPVDGGSIVEIPLSLIHVDPAWNVRSSVEADMTNGESEATRGWFGNLYSIARDGQRDAVTVRPNPLYGRGKGPAAAKPYSLVTGFGRELAIRELAAGKHVAALVDPTKGALTPQHVSALRDDAPTIKAVVKKLTESEARAENIGENVQRDSLSGPDLCNSCLLLEASNPGISGAQMAVMLNRNQPYVAKLIRIAKGLHATKLAAGALAGDSAETTVLESWRRDTYKVPQTEMDNIAKLGTEEEKATAYLAARKKKLPDGKEKAAGKGGNGTAMANIIADTIPAICDALVALEATGFIEVTNDYNGNAEALAAAFIGVKRGMPREASGDDIEAVHTAIIEGMHAAREKAAQAVITAKAAAKKEREEAAAKQAANKEKAAKAAAKKANGAATAAS